MSGRLNFEFGFNAKTAHPLGDDTPMRMYFLGDFTGVQSACINKVTKIDIDNFDDVMVKLSPSVRFASGHLHTFSELEDFHPDMLFEHDMFKNLRRLKRELSNSSTADSAADAIVQDYQLSSEIAPQSLREAPLPVNHDNSIQDDKIKAPDDMFERLLGKKQTSASSYSTTNENINSASNIDRLLSDLLSDHIVQDAKPEHKNLMTFLDTAIEELMKSILHSEEFQALESAWRSVRDVIFNEEYDDANQFFYLVDTDKTSLKNAAEGDPDFIAAMNKHLKNTDSKCYDVLVGNYAFSDTKEDITTLNFIASFAESLNCLFVSGAEKSLLNTEAESLWHQFKKTPQASHVALSYPRVLLRIPYGKKHEEVDSFAFEEFNQSRHLHNKLVWGNSAFSCARLLIRQYYSQTALDKSITELPAFVYIEDGESKLQACGEFLFSDIEHNNIQKQGVTVFASFRNKNCIRLFGDGIHAVNTNIS